MKKTSKSTSGTSFQRVTISATVEDLRKILGEPDYEHSDGSDKTNIEWEMETESGEVFTVYDWKEYRRISEHETIEWHIGSISTAISWQAQDEILEALNNA